MKQRDTLDAQLQAALDEIDRLRSELKASERHLVHILELLEQQQSQLNTHEASIVRLDRVFTDVTNGRLWRTLRAAGGIVKKLLPGAGTDTANGRRNTFLMCDEPQPNDFRPRSGIVPIRGWALAEGGVDRIELEIAGIGPQETTTTVLRPDVKKSHPDLDATGRSGFIFHVDTLRLANGRHSFTLRLLSAGVPVRQAKGFLVVDHQKGFVSDYHRWINEFEIPENSLIDIKAKSFAVRPLISVLMPVYDTNPEELSAAIESVVRQSYPCWELCIANDASGNPEVQTVLDSFARELAGRIKLVNRPERGGISQACNSAWELASGDYICFLDHDDTLSPHALAYVCEAINQCPTADLLYSDEDKIDERGDRFEPFFKPDWSPDTILSLNYVCHLLIIRQDLARKTGCFDSACDGSQDYDLILRASEQAERIEHIPKVLYHWRAGANSTALSPDNKSFAIDAAQRALHRHCARLIGAQRAEPGLVEGRWRIRYHIPPGSRVSIIIASGGKADVLRANLDSIFEKTTYRDYEVVVIDNSKNNLIEKLVSEFHASHNQASYGQAANGHTVATQRSGDKVRYIDWRSKAFNYSAINNAAARECESPVLLFLNDDTSVINPDWLEAMVELAVRPEVGAVGVKLLYPNGAIQHAGVVMGLHDNCGHAFKGLDDADNLYFDFPDIIRNVSAVTGACLMCRADVFWKAGGFDETQFAVAFNDIDLCLKIGNLGYRVLYTPHAQLYHHESFSKTAKDLVPHPAEVAAMRAKWGSIIAHDPYYSPNLTRNDENYGLRTRG